jgi:hypothetical protein
MNQSEFASKIRAKYPGAYNHVDDETLARKVIEKYPVYADKVQFINKSDQREDKGMLEWAWGGLSIPEKVSREGLNKLADLVPAVEPTGSTLRDVALNSPKVVAETMAEVAPSFISRGSILTAGAGQLISKGSKALAPIAKGGARQLEEMSGIAPKGEGALSTVFNDPSLYLTKGKKAASALYDSAKNEMPKGTSLFEGMYKPEEILDSAKQYISKGGTLEPAEGFVLRKAIDKLLKSGRYIKDSLIADREIADSIAKQSPAIAKADPMFKRALQSEAITNIFPQNKLGGASPFKVLVGRGLSLLAAPLLSPAVQGVGAAGLGLAYRGATNPAIARTLGAGASLGLRRLNKEKDK